MTTDDEQSGIFSVVPVLRQLESGLASPVPARLRILRELEFDLEELQGRFRADGLSDEEARRRAIEALVPDGEALETLDRLHMPWYRRVTRRLSPADLRLAERGALVVATASVLIGQTLTLMKTNLLGSPSLFLWPFATYWRVSLTALQGGPSELRAL